jgi:hypothetical protein
VVVTLEPKSTDAGDEARLLLPPLASWTVTCIAGVVVEPATANSTMKLQRGRLIALTRAGWQCEDCGRPADTTHHVWPRRSRGPGDAWNLRVLCDDCHAIHDAIMVLKERLEIPYFAASVLTIEVELDGSVRCYSVGSSARSNSATTTRPSGPVDLIHSQSGRAARESQDDS